MYFENELEEKIIKEDAWLVEVKGSFEVVDGGDTETESGFPSWVVGTLFVEDSEYDLSIMIADEVFAAAKLTENDIDDGVYTYSLGGHFEESSDPIVFNVVKIENK